MKNYRIHHGGEVIDFEITHRPAIRKRIHLEIDDTGGLQVVAPRRMSRRTIQRTLQQRAPWVSRFLLQARARQSELPKLHYLDGESHFFRGEKYPLEIRLKRGRVVVEALDSGIRVSVPEPGADGVRAALEKWYRQQAQKTFQESLERYSLAADWTGDETPHMRLRKMKRTWGSCSSSGQITLNPHLVKAPPKCIDYVIAHEICHLREHNHGKAFYALQQQLYPNWREAKTHLADKGHIYLHS
jgi:predicted metal-dependent hydrolase